MIKLIYAAFLFLMSSAVVVFTKEKPHSSCKHEVSGIVGPAQQNGETMFLINGNDGKVYHPLIEKEGIILAAGQKVRVCFEPVRTEADKSVTITVNDVTDLP